VSKNNTGSLPLRGILPVMIAYSPALKRKINGNMNPILTVVVDVCKRER